MRIRDIYIFLAIFTFMSIVMVGFVFFELKKPVPSGEKIRTQLPQTLHAAEEQLMPFTPAIVLETPGISETALPSIRPAPTSSPELSLTGQITIWHPFLLDSMETKKLKAIVEEFNNQNPDVKINLLEFPATEIVRDYKLDVLEGSGPDILVSFNHDLGNWVRDELISPMSPVQEELLTNRPDRILHGISFDGKVYTIPFSESTIVLYYNKDLVDTPPHNTDELLQMILNGGSLVVLLDPYYLYGWVSAFGGNLVDEKGFCNAGESGWENYLDFLIALRDAGVLFEDRYIDAEQFFLEGSTGMFINESRYFSEYRNVLGDSIGIIPLPDGPGGQAEPFSLLSGFYINPNTKNLEVVNGFLDYLLSNYDLPAVLETAGLSFVDGNRTGEGEEKSIIKGALSKSQPFPQDGVISNYWIPFGEMFIDVLKNEAPTQAAIIDACQQMNAAAGNK